MHCIPLIVSILKKIECIRCRLADTKAVVSYEEFIACTV